MSISPLGMRSHLSCTTRGKHLLLLIFCTSGFQSNLTADPIDPKVIEERRDKAYLLRWITLGLGASMLSVSAINYIMFVNYRKRED
jgi:hypothetical protein